MLDVGDGNAVYWETRGNPRGKPGLVVHGGPGSSCEGSTGRSFDPDRYRIVLFDQRGCGRSVPHASDPATDMSVNTTEHLLADMELLREHLGIERWLLCGGSWGSTLILHWLERFPGLLYIGGAVLAWTAAKMLADEPLLQEFLDARSGLRTSLFVVIIGGVLGLAWLRNRKTAASRHDARKEAMQ